MDMIREDVFSEIPRKEHKNRMLNPGRSIIDPNGIKSSPPVHINPDDRANELLKVKAFIQNTGEKQARLDSHKYDSGMIKKFKKLCERLNLEFDKEYFKELKGEAKDYILSEKYKWNLPRPSQTAKILNIPFNECIEELASDSPTYPSGHSFYANMISGVLIKKYPERKNEFLRLSNLISLSRILAGAHYMPDILEGKRLANEIISSGVVKLPKN